MEAPPVKPTRAKGSFTNTLVLNATGTPPEVMCFVTTEPKSDSNLTLNHTWIWGILIRLIISALSHFLWVGPE